MTAPADTPRPVMEPSCLAYRQGMFRDVLLPPGEPDPGYRMKLTSAAGETHWFNLETAEAHALMRLLTGETP